MQNTIQTQLIQMFVRTVATYLVQFPEALLVIVADNLGKCLSEFGVCNGSRLKVDDFLQNMTLVVTIVHTLTS